MAPRASKEQVSPAPLDRVPVERRVLQTSAHDYYTPERPYLSSASRASRASRAVAAWTLVGKLVEGLPIAGLGAALDTSQSAAVARSIRKAASPRALPDSDVGETAATGPLAPVVANVWRARDHSIGTPAAWELATFPLSHDGERRCSGDTHTDRYRK
ncbi:hypothetical protein B7463_g233, partial [Scytalidium lignicola]